jgi:ABC-type iron transport system FetAB ATPase subunit
MGSSPSCGQKQRVMLARSLYREPRILFLDEGASNLDVDPSTRDKHWCGPHSVDRESVGAGLTHSRTQSYYRSATRSAIANRIIRPHPPTDGLQHNADRALRCALISL